MSYKLKLDVFEGPLDLLLYLIKKNDIDICDIPIQEITEQYMEYIELMKMLDLELVGDFLVMAATLIQIKSKMLLPQDPIEEEEVDDPRDELVRRLQEYKIFKEVAEQLREKEFNRQKLFARPSEEDAFKELKDDATEVYIEASLFELINALNSAMSRFRKDKVYEVKQENYTVEQKIHEVLHYLLDVPRVSLKTLFEKSQSKTEMIVTFMAILELIRLKEIQIVQKRLFADIDVMRNKDNVIPAEPSDDGRA